MHMKKRTIILTLLAGLFLGTSAGMMWFKANYYSKNQKRVAQKDLFCSEERFVAVVINGKREEDALEEVVRGVLTQKYSNFKAYLVVDGSENVADSLPRKHHLSIVPQEGRSFEHALYEVVHELPSHSVVVVIDESEKIVSKTALSSINKYYSKDNVWCTYGQTPGLYAQPYSQGELLDATTTLQRVGPCITFLASLYKKIPMGELLRGISFAKKGYVRPVFACAQDHTYYIDEPLFEGEPYGDQQYSSIGTVIGKEEVENPTCDLVVFSYNRPLQLMALLESSTIHLHGVKKTFVLYRADEPYESAYEHLISVFPHVTFVRQSKTDPKKDFKQKLLKMAFSGTMSTSSHILFGVDDIIVKDDIDLEAALALQEKTHAHGVFLRLGKNIDYCYMLDVPQKIPQARSVSEGVYAYKFADGEADWRYPNTLDMTMYRKSDIEEAFLSMPYTNPSELETEWQERSNFDFVHRQKETFDGALVGLFYESSKVVNIPVNMVANMYGDNRSMNEYTPKELLDYFLKGYRIDLEKVKQVENHSCHAEIPLEFTQTSETTW